MIYVIGHKNPDTDAIVSAIVCSNIREYLGEEVKPIKLGEINKETEFVLNYWEADTPETITKLDSGSQVVLVDHNEKAQAIDDIENLEIVSIIDHHKFNLVTDKPLHIIAQPVGSTATILGDLMLSADIVPTKQEAGLLISAILSDTLHFRSATTTDMDKKIVEELNQIAEIKDLEEYSLQMFNAKSNLGDIGVESLIRLDYKEYDIEGKKVAVGVLETTSTEYGLARKDEIISKMKEIKQNDKIDHMLFAIVNIIEERSIGLTCDEQDAEMMTQAFQTSKNGLQIDLKSLLSRKKQMIPTIENYLKKES